MGMYKRRSKSITEEERPVKLLSEINFCKNYLNELNDWRDECYKNVDLNLKGKKSKAAYFYLRRAHMIERDISTLETAVHTLKHSLKNRDKKRPDCWERLNSYAEAEMEFLRSSLGTKFYFTSGLEDVLAKAGVKDD